MHKAGENLPSTGNEFSDGVNRLHAKIRIGREANVPTYVIEACFEWGLCGKVKRLPFDCLKGNGIIDPIELNLANQRHIAVFERTRDHLDDPLMKKLYEDELDSFIRDNEGIMVEIVTTYWRNNERIFGPSWKNKDPFDPLSKAGFDTGYEEDIVFAINVMDAVAKHLKSNCENCNPISYTWTILTNELRTKHGQKMSADAAIAIKAEFDLTPNAKNKDILNRMLAEGKDSELGITRRTLETYINHIREQRESSECVGNQPIQIEKEQLSQIPDRESLETVTNFQLIYNVQRRTQMFRKTLTDPNDIFDFNLFWENTYGNSDGPLSLPELSIKYNLGSRQSVQNHINNIKQKLARFFLQNFNYQSFMDD